MMFVLQLLAFRVLNVCSWRLVTKMVLNVLGILVMQNLPWDWNHSETAKYFERIIIHMQNCYVQHFLKQYHRNVLLPV